MVEAGTAEELEDTNGMPTFKLRGRCNGGKHLAQTYRVEAALTDDDMERNADAVIRGRSCRSRRKVDAWPGVHDTFAVTVVAGRIFIPDTQAAAERVKAMRKAKTQCNRSR